MKNIVVTGANKGLGLEFTRQLSKDNHVIATARNISSEHELHSLPNVKIKKLDLLSDATIDQFVEDISDTPIYILINKKLGEYMLIAGNWKMNYGLKEIRDFYKFSQLEEINYDVEMCLIPQHPLIFEAIKLFENTEIKIGAQCSHYKSEGAFTGDVSPNLLSEIGCDYVITGHSERRMYHYESDQFVKQTSLSVISKNMIPIICVGETLEEKNNKIVITKNFFIITLANLF